MKNCYKDANRTITELWKAYYKIKPYQSKSWQRGLEKAFNAEYRRIIAYITREVLFNKEVNLCETI